MKTTTGLQNLLMALLAIVLTVSLYPGVSQAQEEVTEPSDDAAIEATHEDTTEKNDPLLTEEANTDKTEGANDETNEETTEEPNESDGLSEKSAEVTPAQQKQSLSSSVSPQNIPGGYAVEDDTGTPTPNSPFDSIGEAVADCITVDPTGTFTITVSSDDAAMGAMVTIPDGLIITITSPTSASITQTQEGAAENQNRHFNVEGNLTLENISLVGVNSTLNNGGVFLNEGLLNMAGTSSIVNCTNRYGGGVQGIDSILNLEDSASISSNRCTAGEGGGVYLSNTAFVMFDNSEVALNTSPTMGGGIKLVSNSTLTLQGNASVHGNQASSGGGGIDSSNSDVTIRENASISGNDAGQGGGVMLNAGSLLTMYGGEIVENTTTFVPFNAGSGAAVYIADNSVFTLYDGLIARNIADNDAGGIYVHAPTTGATATFTMNGGVISENYARGITQGTGYGGGVFLPGRSDIFNMYGGEISNNTATRSGGGVFCDFGVINIDTATGSTSEFLRNTAEYGAGLYVNSPLSFVIHDVNIEENIASLGGGGIFFAANTPDALSPFRMENVSIVNNIVFGGSGGGMVLYQTASAASSSITQYQILNCSFSGNSATQEGGGIYIQHEYSATGPLAGGIDATYLLYGNTFTGNLSEMAGGAMYLYQSSGRSAFLIQDCNVEENSSFGDGGAIYFEDINGGTTYTVDSVNIVSNEAFGNGGGIYLGARAYVALFGGVINNNRASLNGGGVYVTDSGRFVMLALTAISDNPAIYGNEADLSGPTSAGDDVYATGTTTQVSLLDASLMPVPLTGHLDWFFDEQGARYRNGDTTGIYTPITADTSPLALTLGVDCTITYDANGGTGSYSETVVIGTNYTCLTPTDTNITRDGYAFTGWNTQPDGSGTAYDPGSTFTANVDVTLFAQWSLLPEQYTITYDANGGTGSYSEIVDAGTSYTCLTLSDTNITRDGYTFTGWNTQPDGSGTAYEPGATFVVDADITLYAQWSAITPTPTPTPDPTPTPTPVVKDGSMGNPALSSTGDSIDPIAWVVLSALLLIAGTSIFFTSKRRIVENSRTKKLSSRN